MGTLEKERRSADVSSAGAAALKQRRQQRELSERATRRKQLESESRSLFNSVVDALPPTAALEQCTTHRRQCITEMVPEQLLLCVLSGHVEGMKRALHLFDQSLEFYKKALLLRQEGQIANLNTYAQPDQRSDDTARFGCDMRDNLDVMSQCVTITFQHLSTLKAVRTAVSATIDQWGQKISDWDAKIASERRNMFASARASTLDHRPVSIDVLDNRG